MGRFDDDSKDWKQGRFTSVVKEEGYINLYLQEAPLYLSTDKNVFELVSKEEPDISIEQVNNGVSLELSDSIKEYIEKCALVVPDGGVGTGTGSIGSLFVTDVQCIGGITANKQYEPNTVPANAVITSATVDKDTVRVFFVAEGSSAFYSPTITVDGSPATTLQEDPNDKRHFTGYADITVTSTRSVTLQSSTGATASVTIIRAEAGPVISSITFGPYPGSQTELKENDQISVTVIVDNSATSVDILASGASKATTLSVGGFDSGGVGLKQATGTLTISGLSGPQAVTAIASNSLGTQGDAFTSTDTLNLNQTYPSINVSGITYPNSQGALDSGQSATIHNSITDYDIVSYSSVDLVITLPNVFESDKTVTESSGSNYIGTGSNLFITATRSANNAVSTVGVLVKIAKTAPTCSISFVGSPSRLVSSPSGNTYTVRVLPDQELSSPPILNTSIGTLSGSWVFSGGYWRTELTIKDTDSRGTGVFTISMTNLSNITGSNISSGDTFLVGGFDVRTVTFPPFSQKAYIGTNVGDVSKVSAQLTGANSLTFYPDTGQHADGFSIVDSSGNYDPNGDYLWLSDANFASSNSTGTLKCDVWEVE